MIRGIGLDIVDTDRIRTLYGRKPAFARRILTAGELDRFETLSPGRRTEYLAGRFAAKEALAKALGCGIGKELSFQDAAILSDERGKPSVIFTSREKPKNGIFHVSITHTKTAAAAQVIWETE
ncbi:holo-ACP synthase [Alteribacter natronophilus]|uniref:holo-ACP synthase n=1 Tax=Alteribacter natronophilus TaxID=2583810 RepID=UPI00110E1915|nr:holo-ACP synthase [Alteribacter natronophilus]TMW70174.1 holo-[acyl-carrier-protein] synthase [Alteribacter natronophilus]